MLRSSTIAAVAPSGSKDVFSTKLTRLQCNCVISAFFT